VDRPAREEFRRPRDGERLERPHERDEEAPDRERRPERDS
jgi:hypothetical protein